MYILPLRIRRATTDDLHNLKLLWSSMSLPLDDLEKRLTEFQVVVDADGLFLGALGFLVSRQHALVHSEGYLDFSAAEHARDLFWERIKILASNYTVFRLWTRETSSFWKTLGFAPADADTLANLPEAWKNESASPWLTLQLKDEQAINTALREQFADFMAEEKLQTARTIEKAKTMRTAVTVISFLIGILCFIALFYLMAHRNPFAR